MKRTILALAIAAVAPFAFAEPVSSTTTTTTTVGEGQITEYTPGSSFVVQEHDGPIHYRYGKKVEYYQGGKILTDDEVRSRIKVGGRVHVHYGSEGSDRVINRVEIDE
jgi:hypothetical protein